MMYKSWSLYYILMIYRDVYRVHRILSEDPSRSKALRPSKRRLSGL